uniref:Transposase n=1 Tax=Caenorhabditis tropicalis TaxID=1561998 RepID=A0A1I7TSI8_9PELO
MSKPGPSSKKEDDYEAEFELHFTKKELKEIADALKKPVTFTPVEQTANWQAIIQLRNIMGVKKISVDDVISYRQEEFRKSRAAEEKRRLEQKKKEKELKRKSGSSAQEGSGSEGDDETSGLMGKGLRR